MSSILVGLLVVLSPGCERQAELTRDQSEKQVLAVDRPNLVVVIGDDHGFPYFGFMGDEIVRTPNLDRLANEGAVFTTGYVTSSLCRDSLLSILTGLETYQIKRRLELLEEQGIKRPSFVMIQDFQTLAALLKARGYASFQAGKFWGGSHEQAGFTEGTKSARGKEQGFGWFSGGKEGFAVGRRTMQPVYDFIDRHREEPFLMWFSPTLPHSPMDAPARYVAPYTSRGLSPSALKYYANISRFDDVMGKLMQHLESSGVAERTLVVYLSDNGWHQGAYEDFTTDQQACEGPAFKTNPCTQDGQHGKGSVYELGFRTPIVFHWPGRVLEGQVNDDLVSSIDVFHTLLDYADVSPPPSRLGRSLRRVIEEGAELPAEDIIGYMPNALLPNPGGLKYEASGGAFFVRTPAWHYVWFPEAQRHELYAIAVDPEEKTNVVALHPEVVANFRSRIEGWKQKMERSVAPQPPATDRRPHG